MSSDKSVSVDDEETLLLSSNLASSIHVMAADVSKFLQLHQQLENVRIDNCNAA